MQTRMHRQAPTHLYTVHLPSPNTHTYEIKHSHINTHMHTYTYMHTRMQPGLICMDNQSVTIGLRHLRVRGRRCKFTPTRHSPLLPDGPHADIKPIDTPTHCPKMHPYPRPDADSGLDECLQRQYEKVLQYTPNTQLLARH